MDKSIQDIKILDLSRVFAGPHGSMILSDLGAEVVRIEAPQSTDSIREWWPFVDDESTYYMSANRNKKSVTLNLKKERGKEIFLELVKTSDVVLENFKTGTMEKLGLSYKKIKEVNPKIIMCSVTGYGQTGPFKTEPGYDPVLQAVGGVMDVTGMPDGSPTRVGLPIVDILSSLYVVISILSAIRARDKNGKGQLIDVSLLDVQVSSLANVASSYLMKDLITTRVGNKHNNIVPYQVFECKDRPLMVACGNESQFQKFCNIINKPEWIEDERFSTNESRVKHREIIAEQIQEIMYKKTADEWFQLLSNQGVPSGPVNNIQEVFNHPQVKHRDMVKEINHPRLGNLRLVRNPVLFSQKTIEIKSHPPALGEHTDSFLRDNLNLKDEEIKELKKNNII